MEKNLEIDAALKRGLFDLTLPPDLQKGFQAWSSTSRREEIQFILCICLFISACFLVLDVISGQFYIGIFLRLGLQAAAVCLSVSLLNRELHPRMVAVFVMLPVGILIFTTMLLAIHSDLENRETYITVVGIALTAVSIFFRIPIRYAVLINALDIVLYIGPIIPLLVEVKFGRTGAMVLSLALFSSVSLFASARRERSEQDLYLLDRRAGIQALELKRLVGELSRLSNLDALTEIGNRRCFDSAIVEFWNDAARDQTRVGLALIDIDHFKSLNDIAGHSEGDRCLRNVAMAINRHVRPGSNVAARFGGEEFVFLFHLPADPACAMTLAEAKGEALRACVEDLGMPHPGPLCPLVTVSVGVAVVSPSRDAETKDTLIEMADRAMYQAKHGGRNRMKLTCGLPVSQAA